MLGLCQVVYLAAGNYATHGRAAFRSCLRVQAVIATPLPVLVMVS
jgi:hypothetical protein